MPRYNSIRAKQLILLCCWLHKVEPNAKGFDSLSTRIQKSKIDTAVSKKYLQNLWTDINNAVKADATISKSEEHIMELCELAEHNSWEEFETTCSKIESFIANSKEPNSETRLRIVSDRISYKEVSPLFSFHTKLIQYPVELLHYDADNSADLNEELDQGGFLITYFKPNEPDSPFKNLKRSDYLELKKTHRFIPVWGVNANTFAKVNLLDPNEMIIGEPGLLLCMLLINDLTFLESPESTSSSANGNVQKNKVKNNYGVITAGGIHLKKGSIINGREIIINKTKDKNE